MNNKKAFILYSFDHFNNDFIFLKEYYTIKELQKDFAKELKNKNSIYHFIYESIEDTQAMHLLKDKFIIIKETIEDI